MGIDLREKSSDSPLSKLENKQSFEKKKALLIAGPTGVGKTALSLEIAKLIGGEIISADSMQVYRGMDIGTAKATLSQREEVRHHLVDIRDLDESFNVVDFYEYATPLIDEILARGHVPLIVGGTGFYMNALLYGAPSGPPSVPNLRAKLEADLEKFGSEALYDKLRSLDPEYASLITERDKHKIVRGLEIILLSDQKVSHFSPLHTWPTRNHMVFHPWFLYLPKEILYKRIDERCEKMIANGLLEEVRLLEKMGLRDNLSASQAIGYKQCLEYFDHENDEKEWEKFILHFKQASRRYAKRQFTWFRKEELFRWLDLSQYHHEQVIEMILQDFEQENL